MGSCATYSVTVKQMDIISAALPVQDHRLPMSNLDLLLPPLDVGVFFCYKKPLPHSDTIISLIKKSLRQVLGPFYPLAGEVVQNSCGEPELLCNNRGVDFIHAFADLHLNKIDLYHPDESVDRKLVPLKKRGVLTVQVTEMNCGGLVIGCTFDHRIADAYSINMFLTAWAELSRSKPITRLLSFRRSVLHPRRPPVMNAFCDALFVPLSSVPPPKSYNFPVDRLISRIYYIQSKDMENFQSNSSFNGNPKRSKLVSFTAFLWKIIAECDDGFDTCSMGVVVDGRERLAGKTKNYFGNVLSIPYGVASSGRLKEMPVSQIAELSLCPAMTEEHFRGLVDWVELHRPEPAVAKIYAKMDESDGEGVVVSSGQRFPVERVDFGWGRPHFGSYHFPWAGRTGYVMPMPSSRKNGDWIVYMHLLQKHLDLVDTKGSNVFKPLDATYLDF